MPAQAVLRVRVRVWVRVRVRVRSRVRVRVRVRVLTCLPRPHMISSAMTAMPRALAVRMYSRSSSGGHGMAATEEPHCGSISSTPISCSYMSRY